jgi:parallel beta-helix repeat protein
VAFYSGLSRASFPREDYMKIATVLLLFTLSFNISARTIIVPTDFKSIQTAIDRTEPGDTVYLKKGSYKENIVLRDSISLIGESPLQTIIHGSKKEPVIKAGNKCTIKYLTIENGAKGIVCENVIALIQNCIIRKNISSGILCLVTIPDIFNNLILNNAESGIFCESARSIKTSIQHNLIVDNGYNGISLAGRSEVLLQNNVILGNREYGIWKSEESKKSRAIFNAFFANRASSNFLASLDRSNILEIIPYPLALRKEKIYYSTSPTVLHGRGKDGVTIGIINESELFQRMNDPDNDGILGHDDKCPNLMEDFDQIEDTDGCPED